MTTRATLIFALCLLTGAEGQSSTPDPATLKHWRRHTIDGATDSRRGADGVRLGDANQDGLMDTVTGWEEGNAVRVCINPGPSLAKDPWPAVTVGEVKGAEDAVFADLDGDGRLDVVSCTEGRNKTVYFHWAPGPRDYLRASAWRTAAVPVTAGKQAWMFALPMDIDGQNGVDLVVGSKGKRAGVSWLRSPKDPRDAAAWTLHKITDAGWIMSLRSLNALGAIAPVYVTDRKGAHRGLYRLDPSRSEEGAVRWSRHDIGGRASELMFLDLDRREGSAPHVLVATRNSEILEFSRRKRGQSQANGWQTHRIPNPQGVAHGKAVRIGDLDLDGDLDIVHSANTGSVKAVNRPSGVSWMKRAKDGWRSYPISGPAGSKFDRIELLDLDGDTDLDVITCEENGGAGSRGLGLIWYENPTR